MVKVANLRPAVRTMDTTVGRRLTDTHAFTDTRRGTAAERGYGWEWKKLRDRIMVRDGWRCQPCARAGRLTSATEVDHILNKAVGGDDSESNLQAICRSCHREKTARESRGE